QGPKVRPCRRWTASGGRPKQVAVGSRPRTAGLVEPTGAGERGGERRPHRRSVGRERARRTTATTRHKTIPGTPKSRDLGKPDDARTYPLSSIDLLSRRLTRGTAPKLDELFFAWRA